MPRPISLSPNIRLPPCYAKATSGRWQGLWHGSMGGGGSGKVKDNHRQLQEASPGHSNPVIPLLASTKAPLQSSSGSPPRVPHRAFVTCFRVSSECWKGRVEIGELQLRDSSQSRVPGTMPSCLWDRLPAESIAGIQLGTGNSGAVQALPRTTRAQTESNLQASRIKLSVLHSKSQIILPVSSKLRPLPRTLRMWETE